MRYRVQFGSCIAAFCRNDHGSATAEMVVWLPLFVDLVLMTVDVSHVYWRHAQMWTAAFDAVRQVAMGSFDGEAAPVPDMVTWYVNESLGPDYTATYERTEQHHRVSISLDLDRLSLLGSIVSMPETLTASVSIAREDL